MTSARTNIASTVAVLTAGVVMWDAWEKYKKDRTWLNLAAFLVKVLAFCVVVDKENPSLVPTMAAVLVPAAQALAVVVEQLRREFPRLL
ncbi:MAG TPA: hypothetical protein VFW65_16220 [Pseudonocardiaceae bacterium]|nr:hypothetical protein [Pseudonocardiaceae bacterium]